MHLYVINNIIYYKKLLYSIIWRVHLQKQIDNCQKSCFFFSSCIPINLNKTAVGLFLLIKNNKKHTANEHNKTIKTW